MGRFAEIHKRDLPFAEFYNYSMALTDVLPVLLLCVLGREGGWLQREGHCDVFMRLSHQF